jgi:hypothetical protein
MVVQICELAFFRIANELALVLGTETKPDVAAMGGILVGVSLWIA